MVEFAEIPVIRLGTRSEDEIAGAFRAAFGTTGFGYATDHGVDQALIDAVFAASARFHALPLADRQAIAVDRSHRGYIAINTSTDVTSTLADVKNPISRPVS